jgi:hypothetical protein
MSYADLAVRYSEAVAAVAQLEKHAAEVRRILRNKLKLDFTTRAGFARALRFALGMRARYLFLRGVFISAADKIYLLVSDLKDDIKAEPGRCTITRSTGSGWGRGNSEGERTYEADDFIARILDCPTYTQIAQLINRWNDLAKQMTTDYNSLVRHMELTDAPDYRDRLKRIMPLGGRKAYAAVLAMSTGKLDRSLADQHSLFGWHEKDDGNALSSGIYDLVRQINPRALERGGKAPSVAYGREILKDYKRVATVYGKPTIPQTVPEQPERRLYRLLCSHNRRGLSECLLGFGSRNNNQIVSASMIKLCWARQKELKARKRLAWRLMGADDSTRGYNNTVSTAIVGAIQHIAGDDYYAPAIWYEPAQNGRWGRQPDGSYGYTRTHARTISGFVLMRRNWPDIIHVTPGDENPVETTIDGMTATRYVINPDGSINGRVATARLDAGSEYHFRYQREAALAKLTQRQRIARLIRELRSTPNLCLDDSYAAGNCQPGTMQFCSQLGLAVDSAQRINGTALAKRWRQHNYPQVDRFAGVIAAAKKRLAVPVEALDLSEAMGVTNDA